MDIEVDMFNVDFPVDLQLFRMQLSLEGCRQLWKTNVQILHLGKDEGQVLSILHLKGFCWYLLTNLLSQLIPLSSCYSLPAPESRK